MHTRKTAVALNLAANMLEAGVPVGWAGLDEAPHMYVAKLASVFTQIPHTELDELWDTPDMENVRQLYLSKTKYLAMTKGHRPSLDALSDWLEMCDVAGFLPKVVFIDYLALLERNKFDGKDTSRIPRLAEELQVWTNKHELVTIVLHQVGRQYDSTSRYHGSSPVTPEQLMYGGEQQADIILATYRPALDPIGNMTWEEAEAEGIDHDEWLKRSDRVIAYRDDTMLQLIKNRPGVHLHPQGLRLRSVGLSQKMEVVT
jgi:hypothetical protein